MDGWFLADTGAKWLNNPLESIVFQANGSNVDTVMINGNIRKRRGKMLYRNLSRKKELLIQSGRRILKGMKW